MVAAGGRGDRSGSDVPKQFLRLAGVPVIVRATAPLLEAGCAPTVVAAPEDHVDAARSLFRDDDRVVVVAGGATRSASVAAALQEVTTDSVLVHDAARPFAPVEMVRSVIAALARADAVVPAVPLDETLKRVEAGEVVTTVDRSSLWRTQTPQGFRTEILRRAHREHDPDGATDDAMLVERLGVPVEVVPGSRRNIKLTFPEDLVLGEDIARSEDQRTTTTCIGHGFDVHRFEDGRPLILGGIHVPHPLGLGGHSDADVLSHAIADAILGAARLGDLGSNFPDDERWRGASSLEILTATASSARERGWEVANVDATVVAETPRLSSFRDEMASRIADALGISADRVSVKATTSDGLGATGRGEGIAAHAVVLLQQA